MPQEEKLSHLLEFAVDAAWQTGKVTLEYFQTGIDVLVKPDSSPVTIADKRGEEKLRALISARFPNHSILGEEFGARESDSPYRWIIDPIDGTRSFVRGMGLYGVLIGLEVAGEPVLGVINCPAMDEMVFAARGEGCYWNGRRARVSDIRTLDKALLLTTDIRALHDSGRGPAFERLAAGAEALRTWGDCYGHVLVATGRAEIMLDPIMNAWDCAPVLPIMIEAGGRFGDWTGKPTIWGGSAISTNAALFDAVIETIGPPVTN